MGCPENAGAAGTRFDLVPETLVVSNNNKSTQTDTVLMEFPTYPLWENVYVEDYAKVAIPLLWSRVQVRKCYHYSPLYVVGVYADWIFIVVPIRFRVRSF